jgi:2,4-dienoyl-CoA reductase-like NADH-dependent reductase (Old Yellow Enzyme family)
MPNGRKAAPLTRGNFRPCDDNVIPSFAKVAGAIKDNGAIAVQQLYHVGAPTAKASGSFCLQSCPDTERAIRGNRRLNSVKKHMNRVGSKNRNTTLVQWVQKLLRGQDLE